MLIYEITLKEASAFMAGLSKSLTGQDLEAGSQTGLDAPGARQDVAAELSGPAVQQLAKAEQGMWTATLSDLMKKTMNPGSNKPGVIDASQVPEAERARALDLQINRMLQRLSRNEVSNYQEIAKVVAPEYRSRATGFSSMIGRMRDQILSLSPTKDNQTQLDDAWKEIAQSGYESANMARFQPDRGQAAGGLQRGADTQQVSQAVARSGLNAKNLNINYRMSPTNDAKFNALMQTMGFMKPGQ